MGRDFLVLLTRRKWQYGSGVDSIRGFLGRVAAASVIPIRRYSAFIAGNCKDEHVQTLGKLLQMGRNSGKFELTKNR